MNSFNIKVYYLVFANYSQKTLPMMRKKRKSLFPTALPIMDQCLLILRLISGWTSGPVDQWTCYSDKCPAPARAHPAPAASCVQTAEEGRHVTRCSLSPIWRINFK